MCYITEEQRPHLHSNRSKKHTNDSISYIMDNKQIHMDKTIFSSSARHHTYMTSKVKAQMNHTHSKKKHTSKIKLIKIKLKEY
jgi:hypothetical protein